MTRWLLFLTAWLLAAAAHGYEFPHASPFVATVLGTPPALRAELPELRELPRRELSLTIYPEREVPEVFWYDRELRFSLVAQRGPAPLAFVIAGTGVSANSGKMPILQRALYGAGFHVLSLPSPTHANFVTAASSTHLPGHPETDAHDLYRAMELAYAHVAPGLEVDHFVLVGYSLGGLHAAFVTRVDDERKRFDFRRVLMINPPVSLFDSVARIDGMVESSGLLEPARYRAFSDDVFRQFSDIYRGSDAVSLTGEEFLFQAYREMQPSDATLAALIGLVFRFSSASMVFVSDVLTTANYIKPVNLELTPATSLTAFGKVAMEVSYVDYFNDLYAPYFRQRLPGVTDRELIDQASLRALEQTLRHDRRIGLLHNADDIVMLPGEVDYLAGLLGARAVIYPRGGHCGNLDHRDNVAAMVAWLRGE
jgi:pimeloyl-ACP methyl ester carboxylesterase